MQLYETFDMVKQTPDGVQRVIGRTDNSIRIKGVDWMSDEVAMRVVRYFCRVIPSEIPFVIQSAEMNEETRNKLQSVEFCELQGENDG